MQYLYQPQILVFTKPCLLILGFHVKQVILLCMFERSSKVGIGKGDNCVYMNQMFFLSSITKGLYFQHSQLSEALTEAVRLSRGHKLLVCEEQAGLCDHKFRCHVGHFLFFVELEWSFLFILLFVWYRSESSIRYFQHQIHQFCLRYSFEKDVQY